jgi:hypothetical protein
MTDLTNQTTRFGFQKIGGAQVAEPRDDDTFKNKVDSNLPDDMLALTANTAGSGVAVTSIKPQAVQRMRLTLTGAVVAVANGDGYGSLAVLTWANRGITVVNARMNLSCVKDGAGYLAASTPSVGIGSAAASNATLATTMIDTVDKVALAGTLTAAAAKNGPVRSTTATVREIAAGASNKLYLNVGGATQAATDATLTVSGTIDVDYIDLGGNS